MQDPRQTKTSYKETYLEGTVHYSIGRFIGDSNSLDFNQNYKERFSKNKKNQEKLIVDRS